MSYSNTCISADSGRWWIAAVAAFGALAWALFTRGEAIGIQGAWATILLLWSAGLLVCVAPPARLVAYFEPEQLATARALWASTGAAMLANLIADPVRLVMFIIPLYSVLHAALRLTGRQVATIVIVSFAAYALPALYTVAAAKGDVRFTLFSIVLLAMLNAGIWALSSEIRHLRDSLQARNAGLRDAMGRMQDLALKDDLTGLHNRRYILEVMQRQKGLADRGQKGFSLCYCDIDHFKFVNDKYGHAIGDDALRRFAKCLNSVVRNVDYVARFGGEEFLLVLEEAPEETALQVATRLVNETRNLHIPGTDEGFKLTVSVGIAHYSPGQNIDDVLNQADKALYNAKNMGRDRIIVF